MFENHYSLDTGEVRSCTNLFGHGGVRVHINSATEGFL